MGTERDPGGVRAQLANPTNERRLLELSVGGRVVADGTEEDQSWARRMDDLIAWEGREGGGMRWAPKT
jgi:hypothetical protein